MGYPLELREGAPVGRLRLRSSCRPKGVRTRSDGFADRAPSRSDGFRNTSPTNAGPQLGKGKTSVNSPNPTKYPKLGTPSALPILDPGHAFGVLSPSAHAPRTPGNAPQDASLSGS